MSTDPRIEAAAKAIYDIRDDPYDDEEWQDLDSTARELFDRQATVAVAAADKASTITTEAELDALPAGTLIMCANVNPTWPDVFLHTGARVPWLALDPSDREDGESTLHSGNVLNWHGKGEARVIHWGQS